MSPQTEEEGSLPGCSGPSGNSAMWSDEKGKLPATGVRHGAPESDSGEEVLKPLGRSDLVKYAYAYRNPLKTVGVRDHKVGYASKHQFLIILTLKLDQLFFFFSSKSS